MGDGALGGFDGWGLTHNRLSQFEEVFIGCIESSVQNKMS